MATTGERLVEMSILTTGTALDHFLNISFGGGGGGGDATNYLEQAILELIFLNNPLLKIGDQNGINGSEIAGNLYIGLFTDDPGETGVWDSEADYDGYTRVPVIRESGGWEFADGGINNVPIITWPPIVSGSQTVRYIAIIDSLVGGNVLFKKEISSPKTISAGDQYQIAYKNLLVKMD
jgi:hypothetical protein